MARPELQLAKERSHYVGGGETATGLGQGQRLVQLTTTFDVEPELMERAVDDLRTQAEALGYKFNEVSAGFFRAEAVPGIPGAITITESTVVITFSLHG